MAKSGAQRQKKWQKHTDKRKLTFWLSPDEITQLDKLAESYDNNRTDWLRHCLAQSADPPRSIASPDVDSSRPAMDIRISAVQRVIFSESGFHVLALSQGVTAVVRGEKRPAKGGKQYQFKGVFVKHPKYGINFEVAEWLPWDKPSPTENLDRIAVANSSKYIN